MSNHITFRPYRPGDEEKIADLLDIVFKGWPKIDTELTPVEYWLWKYMENPLHKGYVSVGLDGEKVVSSHHNMTLNIKIQDEIIYGGTAVDFAVHPDYRGKGLASRSSQETLKQRLKDNHKFSYFLTRNPILIKRFAGTKDKPPTPRFPHDIMNLTKIENVDLHFEKIPVKNQTIIKTGVKALKAIKRSPPGIIENTELEIKEITQFDDTINEFLERITKLYDFIVVRNKDYLNWKYAYPLLGDYKIYTVNDNKGTQGYMVLRINKYNKDYPIGYIVDLLTDMDKPDAVKLLVNNAIEYFDRNQINITNCQLVKGHPYVQTLMDYGFLDSRIKINLYNTKTDLGINIAELRSVDPSKVYISWGDHDALPVGISPHE